LIRNETVEKIAEERGSICNKCEFIDRKGSDCAVPGTAPCCSQCGCCLHLKTRSLSSECPEGFWPIVLTSDEESELGL
jgi:hypothetical protein